MRNSLRLGHFFSKEKIIIRNGIIKKIARYSRLAKGARKIVVIRSEIASGTYHAKILIERLKKLEGQDIVIHSLTYALLELQIHHDI